MGRRDYLRQFVERLEAGRKVPQELWLAGNAITGNRIAASIDLENRFDYVIDVALGVRTMRNGEPHQFHAGGPFVAVAGMTGAVHN